MNTIQEQLQIEIDDTCEDIKRIKLAVSELVRLQSELNRPLAMAEASLRAIQGKSFIANNRRLVEGVESLDNQISRIRELKNTMDMGTLVVRADRVTDELWQSLP